VPVIVPEKKEVKEIPEEIPKL